jgi:nitric oxide reductase large subunit
MFGLAIPIQFYIYAALSLAAISGIGYGKYQSVKYDSYVAKTELAGKEQEMINKAKAKEANQVTEKVKNDYQNKLNIIKSTYGGLRLSSSSQARIISNATSPVDGTATDPQFVEKCAITTLQLVSLQDWLKEQIGIFNAK